MSAALDTSVIVRYLVQDDPRQGAAATALVDGDGDLAVSMVALGETAFVLAHHYGVRREEIVDSLVGLLRRRNIRVIGADTAIVAAALLLCRSSARVSFADALIHADTLAHGLDTISSFDRRFPADGLHVASPGQVAAP